MYLNSGTKHFVLSARDSQAVEATKSELLSLSTATNMITVNTHVFDFGHVDTLSAAIDSLLDTSNTSIVFNKVYLINNAGSMGPLHPIGSEAFKLTECVSIINANISSCFYLTNEVVKRYKAKQFKSASELFVVNISSLAAIQPFLTFGLYGTGKAARDMFHKILAEEHKNGADGIRVLNYAPGPLDTDMSTEILTGSGVDKDTQVHNTSINYNRLIHILY